HGLRAREERPDRSVSARGRRARRRRSRPHAVGVRGGHGRPSARRRRHRLPRRGRLAAELRSGVLGVAFEGCACRAAFHAGVAAALEEARLPVTLTAGTSSGSLCAAGMAAGRGRELPTLWRALVDALDGVDLRDRAIEALVVATRLRDWQPVVFSSRTEAGLVEPILGSCFLPPFYGRAIRVDGDLLLDGGFTDNLPIEALAARGADDVIAVVASHRGTALKSPLRPRWRPTADGTRVHVIHPERPLEIGAWDFSAARMDRALDAGYRRGRAFVGS